MERHHKCILKKGVCRREESRRLTLYMLTMQAKIMRLSGTAPAVAAAGELLEQLKAENATLQSDNDRLLSYMDTLTSTASGGLNSGDCACLHFVLSQLVCAHDCFIKI